MNTKAMSEKDIIDNLLLKTFIAEGKHDKHCLFYKIEHGRVEFEKIQPYGYPKEEASEGFTPISETSYDEIRRNLVEGNIFCEPFAKNLRHNIFDLSSKKDKDKQLEIFKNALSIFGVKKLKKNKFAFVPSRISLEQCKSLFEYSPAEKLTGKEIFSLLENISLQGHYFDTITQAFKKAFSYIKFVEKNIEDVQENHPNSNPVDVDIMILNKKEDFIKSFMSVNEKFLSKGTNRVWFKSMLSELDSTLDSSKFLGDEKIDLFEVDTWKHATVELSKHGLYHNYPMKPSISSYNAQSTYKSMLSQFATFIASNDTKLGWGLSVEQAHVGTKKNGNYLFSFSHSTEQPNTEKIQKLLKSFFDYLKPAFISEEESVTKAINEAFSDKVKLRKIMSNVVLYNDLNEDMPENNPSTKRKNKI